MKGVVKNKETTGPFTYLAKSCTWWPWIVSVGLGDISRRHPLVCVSTSQYIVVLEQMWC